MSVLLLYMPGAFAAEKADRKGEAPAAAQQKTANPAQPAQAARPAINPITEAATKAGVKTCADRINQTANFLTSNTESRWQLMLPRNQPDKLMVSASMEVATSEVPFPAYVSASFAPNQLNGCSGIYETVVYWDAGCPDVAKKQFPTLKSGGILQRSITVLEGAAGMKVFLMPAGKGCIAIKKELMQ